MTERPIIFSGPMIRAILDGRKTMTRRVIKSQPNSTQILARDAAAPSGYSWISPEYDDELLTCPYGQPGDQLWVRETWADTRDECRRHPVSYRADWNIEDDFDRGFNWRPSIHMPRWASRITLEVTGVRVEQLCDITEEDAIKEGVDPVAHPSYPALKARAHTRGFCWLWDSLNSKRGFGWEANPFVWVIEFKKL